MHAIVTRYKFKRRFSEEMQARVEREFVDPMRKMPGFLSYDAFYPSADHTEVVSFHTWESAAEAERSLQSFTRALQELLSSELAEPPQRWAGDVAVHHG